jgi:hypothetical protein
MESIPSRLVDGTGTGQAQKVLPNGAAFTAVDTVPAYGVQTPSAPFVQSLESVSGSSDMRVVGSTAAPISFYLRASKVADRYITALSFLIADVGMSLTEFGGIPALTNGCRIVYRNNLRTTQFVVELRSNFDFVRLCLGHPAFGNAANAFQVTNAIGASEAYFPVLKLSEQAPPNGFRLVAGSNDYIEFQIRDDTTAVDAFNCIALGFDRFPDVG